MFPNMNETYRKQVLIKLCETKGMIKFYDIIPDF